MVPETGSLLKSSQCAAAHPAAALRRPGAAREYQCYARVLRVPLTRSARAAYC
jgi:hypothetical protein